MLFKDRSFYSALLKLAVPIMFQNFVVASLNLVDVVMIGQKGDVAVAAVGLAGQINFLLSLLMFGIGTGAATFTAQFWGKGDVHSIRRVLGACLLTGIAGALAFSTLAIFYPQGLLGLYTQDQTVIAAGKDYLRVLGMSFIFTAVAYAFEAILRSIGIVRLPVSISVGSVLVKTFLNYVLIFGNLGAPEMGLVGAAVATLVSKVLECTVILAMVYIRKTPLAASPLEIFAFDRLFLKNYYRVALPVVFNEMIWSFGVTTYYLIYAHIGTDSVAAVNISATIEEFAFVLIIGVANACSILVGNQIGAGNEKTAFDYARRSIYLVLASGFFMGLVLFLGRDLIIRFYQVTEGTKEYVRLVLAVFCAVAWAKGLNAVYIVGIFRSGGDTRFAFLLEMCTIWLVGVPLALIGAFILHLPVYWVVMMVACEELVKLVIGTRRFISKKWINNLVKA